MGSVTGDRWPRVTRRCPCPICGKPDFCQISEDGAITKCMRVFAGSFKSGISSIGEYYLHRLRGDVTGSVLQGGNLQQVRSTLTVQPIATAAMRDAVYGRLL